jgi:hypothetical protein
VGFCSVVILYTMSSSYSSILMQHSYSLCPYFLFGNMKIQCWKEQQKEGFVAWSSKFGSSSGADISGLQVEFQRLKCNHMITTLNCKEGWEM